jgi:hypothetical protein
MAMMLLSDTGSLNPINRNGAMMAGEIERVMGTLDWSVVDSIFRKSAFLRSFTSDMHVRGRSTFIATFKTLETPAPIDIRNDATSIYRQLVRQLASAIFEGKFVKMGKLICREASMIQSKGREMRQAFEDVHKHNSDTMWWLTFGQYLTASVGLAAGTALVILGTGGAVTLAAAAASGSTATATFLTLEVSSAAALTTTSIACNVAVSTTRGWADAHNWSGLAVGGINQAELELKRQATGYAVGGTAGYIEKVLTDAAKSIVDPEKLGEEFVNLASKNSQVIKSVARVGYTSLPVLFATVDLYNESNQFRQSIESPEERSRRMQTR